MGRITGEYLKVRRGEASPELTREIDRVWAEIVADGR
jgi:hypothetical protein